MAAPILYIGNKNYSSWSMRPWLALKWGAIAFDERVIPLGGEGYGKSQIREVVAVSPSGRVPALHADGAVIYDSLAICEWAAEQAPSLWPKDKVARALARSAAAEMHSGFAAIRNAFSMNIRRRMPKAPAFDADTAADLDRLFALWRERIAASGGPFLFGERCIADAMFAPVATRLRTYHIDTPADAAAYCSAIFADDAFKQWEAAGGAEPWVIEQAESLYQ